MRGWDGLHIAENHILVETVDIHTGEVLEPGQVGELVFTTLRKHARPLIRFRTGDIGWIDNTLAPVAHACRIHISGRKTTCSSCPRSMSSQRY
ncbi:MAG: hypothetical protein ACLTDS_09645 [Bianqueaceae bacterium]